MARSFKRSFAGGIVSREFIGRVDDVKYPNALLVCDNFIVKPHGPLENRAGFRLVREVKDSSKHVRLVPFVYNAQQSFAVELGDNYARFHTDGGTLMDGSNPYEITTSYSHLDLPTLRYTQSADVLTFTSLKYPPSELRRLGPLSWDFSPIDFTPQLPPPTGLTAVEVQQGPQPTEPEPETYSYVVTAIGSNGSESQASSPATATSDLLATNNYIQLSWELVVGAIRYRVYKSQYGVFGFIGETAQLSFRDTGIALDPSRTPITPNDPFAGPGNWPQAVGYADQRRWFASTDNKPQSIFATKSGTESDMSYSIPFQDSDSLEFRVAAREAAAVEHILPLQDLVFLTNSGEWRITSGGEAITPLNVAIRLRPQSFIGANAAQPVIVNNVGVFATNRGGHVRQIGYSDEQGGFVTSDLSLRAFDLFEGLEIVDMAYTKAPVPIIWCVSSDGSLLGLTYIPEEEVWAWHRHTTDGTFESVCAIPDGEYDAVYVVVRRFINGSYRRFVERMEQRRITKEEDNLFFVDCGLSYSGEPATVFSGLGHLEGKEVAILGDNGVFPRQTVVGGQITLPRPASRVVIGLPYVSRAVTVDLAVEAEAFGQGRVKTIGKVFPKVYRSGAIKMGSAGSMLTEYRQRTFEPPDDPPALFTGEFELDIFGDWTRGANLEIVQDQPLPATIVAVTMDVGYGG